MSKQLKKKSIKNKKGKYKVRNNNTEAKVNNNVNNVNVEVKEKESKKIVFKDSFLLNLLFITLFTFTIEMIFRKINNYDLFCYASLRILLSTFFLSFIVTLCSSLFKWKWVRNVINILYVSIYAFYSWLQLGFMNFLGVYISFNTSSQAGAVKDYIKEFLNSFKGMYFLIFIPLILVILFYIVIRNKEYKKVYVNLKMLYTIPLLMIIGGVYYLTLTVSFMQNDFQVKDNLKLFLNPDTPTVAVNQFGTSLFSLIDIKSYLFPSEEEYELNLSYIKEENEEVTREVSDFLDELAENETDKKYVNLNNYFASQKISDYNDYTGMFKGMNVVFILLESGSYALINEEYYPNFYKLYSEGWYFSNYYSPRNSCATGNNEFSALTGLYSIYNTCTTNTYKNNTYYESMFGIFNDNGYKTTSMHNFTEWYYYRKTSHANMGSTYYGADKLGIKTSVYGEWPSDIELMEKGFDIILNDDNEGPWMTWLTTVTSHQPYSTSSTYGDLYKDYFKKEGYSNNVARYMSKLKVLDEALGYMLDTLENAGELDNTLIVMMPDHYPYGLKEKEIKEMYDTYYDDYEKDKVPLVMYNTNMEAKKFDMYTSYVDLIPTIANLVDVEFDPRLYMGTDLFSDDYESLIIFSDGSWKNEYAYYDASTGKVKEYVSDYYTSEDIVRISNEANLKISMSTLAIKNNYFNYLENKRVEFLNDMINGISDSDM